MQDVNVTSAFGDVSTDHVRGSDIVRLDDP